MRKLAAAAALVLGLAASGMAAEFKGFVEDQMCAGKPEMKGNSECAKKCIKGGSPAVLVGEDGTVYKIANQAKNRRSCRNERHLERHPAGRHHHGRQR